MERCKTSPSGAIGSPPTAAILVKVRVRAGASALHLVRARLALTRVDAVAPRPLRPEGPVVRSEGRNGGAGHAVLHVEIRNLISSHTTKEVATAQVAKDGGVGPATGLPRQLT